MSYSFDFCCGLAQRVPLVYWACVPGELSPHNECTQCMFSVHGDWQRFMRDTVHETLPVSRRIHAVFVRLLRVLVR